MDIQDSLQTMRVSRASACTSRAIRHCMTLSAVLTSQMPLPGTLGYPGPLKIWRTHEHCVRADPSRLEAWLKSTRWPLWPSARAHRLQCRRHRRRRGHHHRTADACRAADFLIEEVPLRSSGNFDQQEATAYPLPYQESARARWRTRPSTSRRAAVSAARPS